MSYYKKIPIAEFVYTEHFKEMRVVEDVYSSFTEKTNANDKFLYVYGLLKQYNWLPQKINGVCRLSQAHRRWRKRLKKNLNKLGESINMDCTMAKKNNDISDQHRLRGNEEFKTHNYVESLKLYTLSMMSAKIDSSSYALSFANRSAALYYLEEYDHCLKDIDQALASNKYPTENIYKLFERKGNCYRQINHQSRAIEMYSDGLLHLNNTTQLSHADKEKIKIRISENIEQCKESTKKTNQMKMKYYIHFDGYQNNNNPVLSKCVELKCTEETGRGLFVSKDIKPGEILIIEKPVAGVHTNNMWIFNCDYCFKRCLSGIPCSKCSRALYCDDTCLQKAYNSYHCVECSLVNPLKRDPTVEPTCDLAMRCFVQLMNAMGIDRYCLTVKKYNESMGNFSEIDKCPMDVFHSIYALNGNETKRTISNLFFMHCTASMMVSLLQLNDIIPFNRIPPNLLGTVGESLVHLLCVTNSNSYASSELPKYIDSQSSSNRPTIFNTVALILSPAYSLINHSCDPNVIVQTYGGIEVTRAIQPISKGSQLFTDYGVNFMVHDKEERNKHLLDQYQFHCQCQACVENWPVYTSLELDGLYIGNHPLSSNPTDDQLDIPKTTFTKYKKIGHLLLTQQKINVDCLDFLFSFLDLLYHNFQKPCMIYYECIQLIKKCLYYTSEQHCVIE